MRTIPIYDATKPISCTIGDDEIAARMVLIERLRAHVRAVHPTEHGVLLSFADRPDTAADLERFIVDEKRCCEFWGFAIDRVADELVLRWDAPPAAAGLLTDLVAHLSHTSQSPRGDSGSS